MFSTIASVEAQLDRLLQAGKKPYPKSHAQTALQLLKRLQEPPTANNSQRYTFSFHKAMQICVKSNQIQLAEELLYHMERHDVPLVTHDTYSIVIAGYAKAGAPREAEFSLYRMLNRAQATTRIFPQRANFESCLSAWCRGASKSAGQRAEQLVLQMQELHHRLGLDTEPSMLSFSRVITAWTGSQHPQTLERATAILKLVCQIDWENPNTRVLAGAMAPVFKLWSQSKHPDKHQTILQLYTLVTDSFAIPHDSAPMQTVLAIVVDATVAIPASDPNELRERLSALQIESIHRHSLFLALIHGYGTCQSPEDLLRTFHLFSQPDPKCWNLVLESLTNMNDYSWTKHLATVLDTPRHLWNDLGYSMLLHQLSGTTHRESALLITSFCLAHPQPTRPLFHDLLRVWQRIHTREAVFQVQHILLQMKLRLGPLSPQTYAQYSRVLVDNECLTRTELARLQQYSQR